MSQQLSGQQIVDLKIAEARKVEAEAEARKVEAEARKVEAEAEARKVEAEARKVEAKARKVEAELLKFQGFSPEMRYNILLNETNSGISYFNLLVFSVIC